MGRTKTIHNNYSYILTGRRRIANENLVALPLRIQKTDYPIVIVLIIEYNIFIISTSIMVHDTSYRKYGGINEKQLL